MLFIGYYNFGEFYIFCNVGKLCCNRLACNMQKKKGVGHHSVPHSWKVPNICILKYVKY